MFKGQHREEGFKQRSLTSSATVVTTNDPKHKSLRCIFSRQTWFIDVYARE